MLIAQITDSHIVAPGEHWLSLPETKTSERLKAAVAYLNEMDPLPDLVLMTGDLADTGNAATYAFAKALLEPLRMPLYVIPGNHDEREEMRKAFSHESYMPKKGYIQYVVEQYPIRLIALDTLDEGEVGGAICEERFAWLERVLGQDNHKPALIFMHHPPMLTGNRLFDSINCKTPQAFESLIKSAPHLLGVLTGHYHHLLVTTMGGKLGFIAPSIAPTHFFAHPDDEKPSAIALSDPAITLHRFLGNGVLTSQIVWIKDSQVLLPLVLNPT